MFFEYNVVEEFEGGFGLGEDVKIFFVNKFMFCGILRIVCVYLLVIFVFL